MPAARLNDVANVYIGFDPRERAAYDVAVRSLIAHSSVPVRITPVVLSSLENAGVMKRARRVIPPGRPMMIGSGRAERLVSRGNVPVMWDEVSQAPMSTEFAISRFAVPLLAQTGWAAFFDCDFVFLGDIASLFMCARDQYAVMCVKHGELAESGTKMAGQPQIPYPRKNWSSAMLFNCNHPANRALTIDYLNKTAGRVLHRFGWLRDEQIGALPAEWNWLVNVQPCPDAPQAAHFTLGGPWLPGWAGAKFDELWLSSTATGGAGHRADLPRGRPQAVPDR